MARRPYKLKPRRREQQPLARISAQSQAQSNIYANLEGGFEEGESLLLRSQQATGCLEHLPHTLQSIASISCHIRSVQL